MKILIVEDDRQLVSMYRTLLQNHDYEVEVAYDGIEGLEKSLDVHPDLILLDLHMPKMGGMELMAELRKDTWGKSVRIIILTNVDPSDDIIAGVNENLPTYYLIKSNTKPEEILEKVKEVIETKKGGEVT